VTQTGLERYAGDVPFLAAVIAVALLVLTARLPSSIAQRSLGEYVFGLLDRGPARVPVFCVVSTGLGQVSNALILSDRVFRKYRSSRVRLSRGFHVEQRSGVMYFCPTV
jgi:hypothetical protein